MVATLTQTLEQRGARYGKFIEHAEVTQELKRVIWTSLHKREKKLNDDQMEALEMIAHKIGRIINGDPNFADHWHDIAGYATLVDMRLGGTTV